MPNIETKRGSATLVTPTDKNGVVICHIVNNVGAWGAGFVLALDDLSAIPRAAYMGLAKDHKAGKDSIPIPTLQWVEVKPGLFVANMVAQRGLRRTDANPVLVDYDALGKCLRATFRRAIRLGYHIHIPSGIGSGLAGGDKATIHKIIRESAEEVEKSAFAQQTGAALTIVLWEFEDVNAKSYVKDRSADKRTAPATDAAAPTVIENAETREEKVEISEDDIAQLG